MISEFFMGLATNFVVWLAGLFGSWTPPEQLLNAVDAVDGFLSGVSGVGVWVDWAVLSACLVASSTTFGIVLSVRVILRLASHVPLFGGAG